MSSAILRRGAVAAVVAAGAALLASACTPTVEVHGHVLDEAAVESLQPGVHDRQRVAETLGSPTNTATFKDETWYYVTRRTEHFAFLEPDVLDQQVVEVHFDAAGRVASVRRYSLADAQTITPLDRATPTGGRKLNFLQQLLGNVGRFTGAEGSQ